MAYALRLCSPRAASMGTCTIISQEDGGSFFAQTPNMRRPDFRIVTHDGQHLLIEVKNFHQNDPFAPYRFSKDYVESLCKYASAMGLPLMFAVYWSKWRVWSLVAAEHVISSQQLSLPDALMINQMSLLGNCMLATTPPLAIRIIADEGKPRSVGTDGSVGFTIRAVEFCANGTLIADPFEKKLAWFFLLNSKWSKIDQPAEITDGKLDYFEISVSPAERDKSQPFAIHGYLSEMISCQYLRLTSDGRRVRHLSPKTEYNTLGILIPKDFVGDVLKLWRFVQRPKLDDVTGKRGNTQADVPRCEPPH